MRVLSTEELRTTYENQERAALTAYEIDDILDNPSVYVPQVTPAYDTLSFEDRMDLLIPDNEKLDTFVALRERSEVCSPSSLYELDLASYSPVGSFKYRGAWNAISCVEYNQLLNHGVVTASAGNHGLGVALAVRRLNELFEQKAYSNLGQKRVRARIFVPETAAPVKIKQIQELGNGDVELVVTGNSYDEAYQAATEYTGRDKKSTFIHPYDDEKVVEGQGSVGTVLINKLKEAGLDPRDTTIVVPVGGGGLLAGVVSALLAAYPDEHCRPKIVGAQLEGADSAAQTWQNYLTTGKLIPVTLTEKANKFADGASVKKVGDSCVPYLEYVDDFVVISEEDLRNGYISALDSIYMNLMEVYGNNGVNPFFGLHEPASMIAEVAATQYGKKYPGSTVVNLKTGINYNESLIEELLR